MKEHPKTTIDFGDVTKVTPVFGGAGYLIELNHPSAIYFSRDAHAALMRFLESHIMKKKKKDGWGYNSTHLTFGDVAVTTESFQPHLTSPDDIARSESLLVKLYAGTCLTASLTWEPVLGSYNGELEATSYDGVRKLYLNPDHGTVEYNTSTLVDGEMLRDAPVIEVDATLVVLADRLYGIANTATFPDGLYELALEMGLGKLNIASLRKEQLLKIAQRLMP